jgi:hypothetical protein
MIYKKKELTDKDVNQILQETSQEFGYDITREEKQD